MNKYKTPKEHQKELEQLQEELKARWPEFEYVSKWGIVSVACDVGYRTFKEFPVDDGLISAIDNDHQKVIVKREFMQKYPGLYPGFACNTDEIIISRLWVCRNGRDAEAITHQDSFEPWEFGYWNDLALEAKQEGWFFCSRCKLPYPKTEYGFMYFAGKYCQKCKQADKRLYNSAMAETYN